MNEIKSLTTSGRVLIDGGKILFLPVKSLAILALVLFALLPMPALAQTYTWNNADTSGGGGFIPGIIFNPSQQNLIYARPHISAAHPCDGIHQNRAPPLD